jgi:UDP-N-acetylglucosamine acyltransferase
LRLLRAGGDDAVLRGLLGVYEGQGYTVIGVGDYAIIGGGAAIIQFARVGHHAFVGGMSGLEHDLIPYGMALGNRAYLSGLNIIGLQRRGFSRASIHDLRRAYRLLFAAEGTLVERMDDVAQEFAGHTTVQEILAFIREGGKRSLCTPKNGVES